MGSTDRLLTLQQAQVMGARHYVCIMMHAQGSGPPVHASDQAGGAWVVPPLADTATRTRGSGPPVHASDPAGGACVVPTPADTATSTRGGKGNQCMHQTQQEVNG